MLKNVLIMVLMFAVGLQTFSKMIIVADYYQNTAAFAKNCINKAKPKLNCKGKCQMAKKLQEEESKEQNDTVKKGVLDITLSSKSFFAHLNIISVINTQEYYITNAGKPIHKSYNFFHPPSC